MKKQHAQPKKQLKLTKETLRTLSTQETGQVGGASQLKCTVPPSTVTTHSSHDPTLQ